MVYLWELDGLAHNDEDYNEVQVSCTDSTTESDVLKSIFKNVPRLAKN